MDIFKIAKLMEEAGFVEIQSSRNKGYTSCTAPCNSGCDKGCMIHCAGATCTYCTDGCTSTCAKCTYTNSIEIMKW